MKIIVKALKPRNPLVAAARLRRAGSHRPDGRAMRRLGSQSLRRDLDQLKQHSP
jgi:hypothetical protein